MPQVAAAGSYRAMLEHLPLHPVQQPGPTCLSSGPPGGAALTGKPSILGFPIIKSFVLGIKYILTAG